jgi:hypothetical protein
MSGRDVPAKGTPRQNLEWSIPMDKAELLAIWKELKSVRELLFKVAMHGEGVRRALEASTPGFLDQRLSHEKIATEFYSPSLHDSMRVIDAAIRRLES